MNKLEAQILDIMKHEELAHEVIAKLVLEIAERAFKEGCKSEYPTLDWEYFKQEIL
jgi:hypothetical protein